MSDPIMVCDECGGEGTLRLHTEATGHTSFHVKSEAKSLLDFLYGLDKRIDWTVARSAMEERLTVIQREAVEPWRKFVEAYLGDAHEDELIAWAERLLEGKTDERK